MRTIRRIYFYAVTLVSLEIILWGLIGLARSVFLSESLGNAVNTLAQALALILVGIPFFGLHWWIAQRDARKEMEEHASYIRALFLYAVLLATLIPAVQNFLAMWNRRFLGAASLSSRFAIIGGTQSWGDNLIAIVLNCIVAAYFITVLRADWKLVEPKEALTNFRRIYRYIWVFYGLVMTIAGVQQLLHFIITPRSGWVAYQVTQPEGINGLALVLLGTPIWVWNWITVQKSLSEPQERESLLRLGVLYFLSLVGALFVLSSGGYVVYQVLLKLFGETSFMDEFIKQISTPLSLAIPLGGVWGYYGKILSQTMKEIPDAPRRAGMRRFYFYILSAVGLGATFIGLSMLLDNIFIGADLKDLAATLATLVTGIPLWVLAWRPMQVEALTAGDAGDHARRSIIRKVYLYLALFISVTGSMGTAVGLVFNLLSALLGKTPVDFSHQLIRFGELLFLFVLMGIYHGLTLRKDGRIAANALAEKHAIFPVLVFDPGDANYISIILEALKKQTPQLPVTIHAANQPIQVDILPKAILLPSDLALNPPKPLQEWLNDYQGARLVIPRSTPGWFWAEGTRPLTVSAAHTALIVRQLAEGQEVRTQGNAPGWMILIYLLAGFSGLEILMLLVSLVVSLFNR